MTHHPALSTDTLWTRAALLLAAFVHAYLSALQFAQMRTAPAVLVRDALNRVRRIEALARRVLFAEALGLRVAVAPVRPRKGARGIRAPLVEAPTDGDPATWRVRFSVPLPAVSWPLRGRTPHPHVRRHPILQPPARMAPLQRPQRPYNAEKAKRHRVLVRDRKEAAQWAKWMAPWPPVPEAGPGIIELPPSTVPVAMMSTTDLARRIEALHRVMADPAPYALRLARRLARQPSRAPRVIAQWRGRTRRVPEGAETLAVAVRNHEGGADDTS